MTDTSAPPGDRATRRGTLLVIAALAYLPPLLTRPGWIAADTKAYLFLDPGRLLSRAAQMWDANVTLGTVTHQNIGYLFPLGPYFWVVDHLPIPMWVGQRIWIGTTLFAAGAGFAWLARRFSLTGWAVLAGSLVYMLSPYTLAYLGRTTVILLPWAALPWLVGLARRAAHEGGWRAPAWFTLVVTIVGGINASSLLFIGLGPVLWFPFAVWVSREIDLRQAITAMLRIGVLLIPTQLWWMAGLSVQAGYGLPILELTESVKTVAQTSTAAEVARHLGYWYFYGRDGLEPWTESSRFYTQNLAAILVSFAIPGMAAIAAFVVRWRYRSYAVLLVIMGAFIGVGTHPYAEPPPAGAVIQSAADFSTAGMAMRNSPRAVPLMVLGATMLLTAALVALAPAVARWRGGRVRWVAPATVGLVAVLAVVNLPPLWTGGIVQSNLEYPEDLPDYWDEVTEEIDARDDGTRVLEIPGMDFGTYRWGNTQDVITPGLVDRPWIGRQLIPYGTPASADLVRAFDRRMQEGTFEPDTLAPVAGLMGAGDILLRSDTQFERYSSPRPRVLWRQLEDGVDGLGEATGFGVPFRNTAVENQPLRDEVSLAIDPHLSDPPPVLLARVDEVRPEVRTSGGISTIVAGDGDGVVDLAAERLLGTGTFVYSGTFAEDPDALAEMADAGARLVLTDTNRRRAQQWGTLRENNGYTEVAGEIPLEDDPRDARLEVFPDADDTAFTTVRQDGVASVQASDYGNPVSYTPEDRAMRALDGSLITAWKVGAFDEVRGERIEITLDAPVATDHVELVQAQGAPNRWITEVEVIVDGESIGLVALDATSRSPGGQRIELPGDDVERLTIVIRDANVAPQLSYHGVSGVGFAEIRIPGVKVEEMVVLPTDMLTAVGPEAAASSPLDIVLTRVRANAAEPFRRDPEPTMLREFELPAARTADVEGTARLAADTSDVLLDSLLGVGVDQGLAVESSDHLNGAISTRGSAAFDGDPSTFWSPGYTRQVGRWIELRSEEPVTFDELDLQILADGRHSVPALIEVAVDGVPYNVAVPPIADGTEENHLESVNIPMPEEFTGNTVRISMLAVREIFTEDPFSDDPLLMPVGIAEAGIADVIIDPPPVDFDSGCRHDLLTVDGTQVSVRITGTTEEAIARDPLDMVGCDDPIELSAGTVEVRARFGPETGLDIDRLVLRSAGATSVPTVPDGPSAEAVEAGRLDRTIDVSGIDGGFWLVFGESHSLGWHATSDTMGDLGEPVLVDGYANGWWIDPPAGTDSMTIDLTWTPQSRVWVALALSALAAIGCVLLLVIPRFRRSAVVGPTDQPILADPRRSGGLDLSSAVSVLLGVVCGFGAFMVGGPLIGAAIGLGAGLAAWRDRGRVLLAVPGMLTLAPVAAYYAARQWYSEPRVGVEWPSTFDPAKWFVVAAFAALAADVIVGWARRRSNPAAVGTTTTGTTTPSEPSD